MIRNLLVPALLALSVDASAQCFDWVDGFGYPGQGFSGSTPSVIGMTVWDDGSGPALIVSSDSGLGGTQTVFGLLKWDGSNWTPLPGSNGVRCRDFTVFDDGSGLTLYGCGPAVNVTGQPVQGVGKYTGGGWTTLTGGAIGDVDPQCMYVHDDGGGPALYIGGTFTAIAGNPMSRIAKWNGSNWVPLGVGVDGQVRAMCSYGGVLYVGGQFLHAGGGAATKLATWNGTTWSSLPFTLSGFGVNVLRVFDLGDGPKLYIGGSFTALNGVQTPSFLRWDGTTITPLGSQTNGTIQDLRMLDLGSGPELYSGGTGGAVGAVQLGGAARWNGTDWAAMQGGFGIDGGALRMQEFAGKLYYGGTFRTAGGKSSRAFGEWGIPCSAPSIVQQPTDVTAVYATDAYFKVTAYGTQPLAYQWRRNGVAILDQPGREGCQTASLRLYYWSLNDAGNYDCVVTGPHGTATSNVGVFTVPTGGVGGIPVALTTLGYPPTTAQGLLPGETLTEITSPLIHPDGNVALQGKVNGVIFPLRNTAGVLAITHRTGDPAPDLPAGTVFGNPLSPVPVVTNRAASTNDQLAFFSTVSGSTINSTNDSVLYYEDAQGTTLVAQEGAQAPGLPAGWRFNQFSFFGCVPGKLAFWAVARSGTTNKQGIWQFDRVNGTQPILIAGDLLGGGTVSGINNLIRVHPTGDVLFSAYNGIWSLWAAQSGALNRIVSPGDPLPGYPGQVVRLIYPELQSSTGDIYITVDADPGSGVPVYRQTLFVRHQGQDTPLVKYGDPAPTGEAGAMLSLPRPAAVNGQGQLLFHAGVLSPANCTVCPGWGLFLLDSNGVTPVMLNKPNPLPGAPAGSTVQRVLATALNDHDQVIFSVELNNNQQGVYGWTSSAGLFPITVPGAQVDMGAAGYRTVSGGYLTSLSDGGLSGNELDQSYLSNSGRFAVTLNYTDSSRGAFEANFAQSLSAFLGAGTATCAGNGSGTTCPCGNNSAPNAKAGCVNSLGLGGTLAAGGVPSLAGDSVTLNASSVLSGPGLYFQGSAEFAGGAGLAFGDGLLCAGGTIVRMGVVFAVANASTYPSTGAPAPISTAGGVMAGDTKYYQLWYRDSVPGYCSSAFFNLTNAVRVNWLP